LIIGQRKGSITQHRQFLCELWIEISNGFSRNLSIFLKLLFLKMTIQNFLLNNLKHCR